MATTNCFGCGNIIDISDHECPYCGKENPVYHEVEIVNFDNNEIPKKKNNDRCGTGFFCGLIGIFFPLFLILPIVSISNCIIGLTEIKTSKEKGKTIAIIGIILSSIALLYQSFFVALIITTLGYML